MVIPSWHTGKLSIGEATRGNHFIPPAQPAQAESSAGWWGVQRCCSATPGQNQEHPFPSHLHGSAVDFCSFSCAALLFLGPVTVSVPFPNPAQHPPKKTSSLLPGYQVELLKQCSPKCQNQQNGQVWGQRGMKSSGQVQHQWRKRRESGPLLLVQGQLGQPSCTTEPHPESPPQVTAPLQSLWKAARLRQALGQYLTWTVAVDLYSVLVPNPKLNPK